jgi:RimJ/RimL family protein N-acetyltransferase
MEPRQYKRENRRMRPLQMPATPPTSEGIVLRPFRDADVGMLRDLATDPYVPLIGSLPANASEREALDFIERQHNRLETGVGYSFCVAELAGETALGTAGLWIADLAKGRATVGYTVAPFARRRGVAVKALRAVTAFGWTLSDLFRIELYVEPRNVGSVRTAEAVAYLREGLLRSYQPIGGRRAPLRQPPTSRRCECGPALMNRGRSKVQLT